MKQFIGDGDSILVHEQAYQDDLVWTVFFWDAFAQEVVLFFCLKVIVCHIVVDKTGITAIVFFDSVVYPYLKVFPVFFKKRKATVNIINRVVCFFKEMSTVLKGCFFDAGARILE